MRKIVFALLFGNRRFFPSDSIDKARISMVKAVRDADYESILLTSDKTRFGAVETVQEGKIFSKFLKENEQNIDGLIISLPNFGDENGIFETVKNWKKPIFIQALEDSLDKMGPSLGCDAFWGKLALMDLLVQGKVKFTTAKPHVINPERPMFQRNLHYFACVCRITNGMRQFSIGAIGARNDLEKVRQKTQGKMTLRGGVSSKLIMDGTKGEIRDKVIDTMKLLGASGGYICQPDQGMPFPEENLQVFYDTVEQFGRY